MRFYPRKTTRKIFNLLIVALFLIVAFLYINKDFGEHLESLENTSSPIIPEHCQCKTSETLENFCYAQELTFNCSLAQYLKWSQRDTSEGSISETFITAASDMFFDKLRQLVTTCQKNFPESKIIVYDLGLRENQIESVKKFCNVEYRKFDFGIYPHYVKFLKEYRWKPLIIWENLGRYTNFWWIDTSLIWKSNDLSKLKSVAKDPKMGEWLLFEFSSHSNFAVTNPGMYKYFPANEDLMKTTKQYSANMQYIKSTRENYEIGKWLALCALDRDCMKPPGAGLGCRWGKNRMDFYADCHRFDQAAVNLLLANHHSGNESLYTYENLGSLARLDRFGQNDASVKIC